MAENPYTRTATVTITELVPDRGLLPQCAAWKFNGLRCANKGKYEQDGNPVCGLHLGSPNMVWHPDVTTPKEGK